MAMDKSELNYGDWVSCDGKIMFVYDINEDDPNTVGLILKDSKKYYDKYGYTFYEATYYPVTDIEVLPKKEIDEDTLLSYFRLEVTPWELAERGQYPISKVNSFILTDDDLNAISYNVYGVDAMSLDAWMFQFINFKPFNTKKEETVGLSLQLTLAILQQNMAPFDVEEDDRHQLVEIIDVYLRNKGVPFNEMNIYPRIKKQIVMGMEALPANEITKDERKGYVWFLEDLYGSDDIDCIRHYAYAYYSGNQLVRQDYDKAQDALLKLTEKGNGEGAYALAHIYSRRAILNDSYYKDAFKYYQMAAEQGMIQATIKVCHMLRRGEGVKRDPEKAFEILDELYDQLLKVYQKGNYKCNYAEIAYQMGLYHEFGIGCPQSLEEAGRYFEMAKVALEQRDPEGKNSKLLNVIEGSIERVQEKIIAQDDFDTLNENYMIS